MNRRLFLSLLAGAAAGRKVQFPRRPAIKALVQFGHPLSFLEYKLAYQRSLNQYYSNMADMIQMAPKAPWVHP